MALDRETQDCLRRMKGGAMLGGAVGSAFGAIFGIMEAIRYREIPVSQVRLHFFINRFHSIIFTLLRVVFIKHPS